MISFSFSNKRLRFLLSSLVFSFLLYSSFISDPRIRLQTSIVGSGIVSIFFFLALSFSIKQKGCVKAFILPVFYSLSVFLIPFYFQNLSRPFFTVFSLLSGASAYVMLLALNILLVSKEKDVEIPLVRPARTFSFFIVQYSLFLFVTILYKIQIPLYFQFGILLIFAFLLTVYYWWSNSVGSMGKGRFEIFTSAYIVSQMFISLSFFPMEDFFRSLIVATSFYIVVNLFQSFAQNAFIRRQMIAEYLAIALSVVILIVLV